MEEVLVSVVIPVYNVEKFLQKCVASVLNQTYRNLDIIRNLNSKSLKNIYLSGNNGITDYSSISSLNWGDKDF